MQQRRGIREVGLAVPEGEEREDPPGRLQGSSHGEALQLGHQEEQLDRTLSERLQYAL